MIQIEAGFNSKPLMSSDDPTDLQSLTSEHLLIEKTLTSISQHDVNDVLQNRLTHYQLFEQMQQHF